jgi:hypothetical protein
MRHNIVIPCSLANLADSKGIIGRKMFGDFCSSRAFLDQNFIRLYIWAWRMSTRSQQTPNFQTDLTDLVRQRGAPLKVHNAGRDLANSLISSIRI